MATYAYRLRERIAQIPQRTDRARGIYADLKPLLKRYHGGMPIGFLAAIAEWESGGKMSSRGDASLGEVGIFQITKSFPPEVGWPPDSRYETEYNVFLGCLEYQIEAVRMFFAQPSIMLGSPDNWKLARLSFAVGSAGTKKLLQASKATSYAGLLRYLDRVGGVALGRQGAGLVWFRAHSVNVQWAIGSNVISPFPGVPRRIPAPKGTSYRLPGDVSRTLLPGWTEYLIAAAVLGGTLLIRSNHATSTLRQTGHRASGQEIPRN